MVRVEYPTRTAAQTARSQYARYLGSGDDKRSRVVVFRTGTPKRVLDRASSEAFAATPKRSRGQSGMTQLAPGERKTLARTTGFDWQQHGFEAMHAKQTLLAHGVTEWQDHYEPGEGTIGALQNLRASKQMSAQTGAPVGVGGDYEHQADVGHRASRVDRELNRQVEGAKTPGLVGGDPDALAYLRQEATMGDVFDISFGDTGPMGRDYERLRDRHADRSTRAQHVDESLRAPVTLDPVVWASDPSRWDYPGIDTPRIDPLENEW